MVLDVIGLPEVIYTSEGEKYLHLPGLIVTENLTGEVRYLLTDGLGSVRHATDDAGAVVYEQSYDPYGNPLYASSDAYGYTGEWWQADVGLLHLRARWYDPASGTFLSRDAVESEPPYQYVRGNPVNWVDPSGEGPEIPWDFLMIGVDATFIVIDLYHLSFGDECDRDYWQAMLNLDSAALMLDLTALVIPMYPGGAGASGSLLVRTGVQVPTAVRMGQGAVKGGQAGAHGPPVLNSQGGSDPLLHNTPQNVYPGKTQAPNWPNNFTHHKTITNNVKNKNLLSQLKQIEPGGKWVKVYENGYINGRQVSVHYFRSKSGKVFNLKIKNGWS